MEVIRPNWPVPSWVRSYTTTREEGHSIAPYHYGNLAHHVEDHFPTVQRNRQDLQQQFNLPSSLTWLEQHHSAEIIELTQAPKKREPYPRVDGSFTQKKNIPCVIMTADCLPLLLCDTQGSLVCALHCGWLGTARGIIENTVTKLKSKINSELIAWMGPAIGPDKFEVGADVYNLFVQQDIRLKQAFKPLSTHKKWLANIYQIARLKLNALGVENVYGGEYCTYTDQDLFYSYRRDGVTGRMATLIWLE